MIDQSDMSIKIAWNSGNVGFQRPRSTASAVKDEKGISLRFFREVLFWTCYRQESEIDKKRSMAARRRDIFEKLEPQLTRDYSYLYAPIRSATFHILGLDV